KTSLCVLNVNDKHVTPVFEGTNAEHSFWDLAWSPDGKRLAWWSLSATQDAYEIRLMRVGAEEKPQVFQPNLGSPTKIPLYFPRWSPDGKKMVFSAGRGIYQIQLMQNILPKADEPGKTDARPAR